MTPTFPRIILEITTKSLYRKVYKSFVEDWNTSLRHAGLYINSHNAVIKLLGFVLIQCEDLMLLFFHFFVQILFPCRIKHPDTHSLLQGALRYTLCVRHLPWFIYGPGLDTGRTLHPGRYEHQDKMLSFP